jgi:hypothetical protein
MILCRKHFDCVFCLGSTRKFTLSECEGSRGWRLSYIVSCLGWNYCLGCKCGLSHYLLPVLYRCNSHCKWYWVLSGRMLRINIWRYQKKKVVGLERGPLSLVNTTEELLDRKVDNVGSLTSHNPIGLHGPYFTLCHFSSIVYLARLTFSGRCRW